MGLGAMFARGQAEKSGLMPAAWQTMGS